MKDTLSISGDANKLTNVTEIVYQFSSYCILHSHTFYLKKTQLEKQKCILTQKWHVCECKWSFGETDFSFRVHAAHIWHDCGSIVSSL